jgi:hypothetical protein
MGSVGTEGGKSGIGRVIITVRRLSPDQPGLSLDGHINNVSMKAFELGFTALVFYLMTELCGRNIEKRNWQQSVMYFLLALGVLLTLVRNTPPF